ncbi:MAG: hypothetical protein E7317_05600 [Clostridiales bacterium]|nr:hypothetical protein [Clostridiales bacterium]
MTDSVERAVWDWLRQCPALDELFFAAARTDGAGAVVVPEEDVELCRFQTGRERQYRFALTRFDLLTQSPNDDANLCAFERAREVAVWIEAQDAAGCLPALPGRRIATGIAVDGLTGADFSNGRCASVTLDVRVDYFEEG